MKSEDDVRERYRRMTVPDLVVLRHAFVVTRDEWQRELDFCRERIAAIDVVLKEIARRSE